MMHKVNRKKIAPHVKSRAHKHVAGIIGLAQSERKKTQSISGAPAQNFARNPGRGRGGAGGVGGWRGDSLPAEISRKPSKSAVVLFESDGRGISGAFSAANTGRALVKVGGRGREKTALAAIHFKLRRRGTKQSSAPFNVSSQFEYPPPPSAHLFLEVDNRLGGKLAYLRLALRTTEESHKHEQMGEMLCSKMKKEKKWVAALEPVGERSSLRTFFHLKKTKQKMN